MPASSRIETLLRYIGANVRRRRVDRGWTQIELAKAAGLKERYVQVLESGKANPTVKVLIEVADALGVAPAELFAEAKAEPRRPGNPRL
jgi:transcriptional regulator with XRE-family HTH domain